MGEECQGALCFVLVYAACCEHGWCFSKRRNSNDEGYNGGGAHPRVCTLLGMPVSLSTTERATAYTLSSSSPIKFEERKRRVRHKGLELTNREGGWVQGVESSHLGQDRHQPKHSSICVSPGQPTAIDGDGLY